MSLNKNAGTALIGLGILTIGGYAALTYLGSQKEKEAEFERTKQEEYEQKGLFGNIGDFLFGKNNAQTNKPATNANPVTSENDYLTGVLNQLNLAIENQKKLADYQLAHPIQFLTNDYKVTSGNEGQIISIIDTKEHVLYDTTHYNKPTAVASAITWDQLNKNTPLASYMK